MYLMKQQKEKIKYRLTNLVKYYIKIDNNFNEEGCDVFKKVTKD